MPLRLRQTTALSRRAANRCRTGLCKFAREEDGVLIKPTIFIFLSMLAVGGIGVDLMRMERDRTELQYTLDRAVLAAADLDQTQTPDAVVLDYLTKSGLSEYYSPPTSDIGLGYRIVTSTVNSEFETHFMNFTGVGSIPIYASSTAEESIDGLEISLVLDVSGSMDSNNRLTNLKVAAKDFIDEMVANTTDGKMSISIIPYATQVSVPEALFDQYNVSAEQDYSHCVNFSSSDFNSVALPLTTPLQGTMHFSPWYDSDYRPSGRLVNYAVCSADADREILPFQKDAATLKAFIQNLDAWGNTSIDLGMKWATTLLDPSAQPAINALTTGADASVPVDFAARPSSYTDADTIKIVVLMTDGQNTSQYYIDEDFRSGMSDLWYNASANRYSSYDPNSYRSYDRDYYWDNYGTWKDHPYGNGSSESGTAVRLSYAELWARTSLKYNYKYIFGEWMGTSSAKNKYYYPVRKYYGTTTKNTRTQNICNAAKEAGIIVYTIGFEAPSGGQAVLQDCASSDAHYFDVNGLEISDAFASIATSIRQLRLTQ
ncbi:TadE/TadG family type IV pilus assembly protein [Parasedimentitalea psychrophila]|uniref:Tad domain-containing protein n=1 Tax=Parasedimentitalea psychrophila TaxID=2997337 RepID=A0A9Y2KW79_9RHOB|nr:TadE/TadG family type IV pilus assembly protein [Parasedimentitalea psychrophila]WIY23818.1 Tad domain-containing protein [Parasedimentitalea psychrophila]